jgi:lysophospholipase L1-like esterase
MNRFALIVICGLLVGACDSTTSPTPPPPTEDPPQITCPVIQPIQLTSGTTSGPITFAPTTTNGKAPVTTACVLPSGSTFPIGTTVQTCTATDALQRTASCTFPITVIAPPPPPLLAVTSFLAFGDSITRGEDGTNGPPTPACAVTATARMRFGPRVILPDSQTYPGQLLATLVARYKLQSPTVDNQGCPGEALNDTGTLTRFDRLVASRRYEAVLIMEGSNDMMLATKDDTKIASALVVLRQLVGDAKSRNIRPLLATIPPIDPTGSRGKDWGSTYVSTFNTGVRGIALGENVPLVDVNAAFNGNLSLLGSDGLHPTVQGYTVIANAFADAIKSALEVKPTFTTTSFRRR